LKPDKYFFRKVLNSHKRIYKALLERDGKKAGKELIGHIREVEKNLVSLQQKVSRIF
jgi:DNA-binding FadR family transcriptional regulator